MLDQVRDTIRVKHHSYLTEQTCVDWIRRYSLFHNKRLPPEIIRAKKASHLRPALAEVGRIQLCKE